MQLFLLISAFALIAIGSFIQKKEIPRNIVIEVTNTPSSTPTIFLIPSPTVSQIPSNISILPSQPQSFVNFTYPGANIISDVDKTLKLQSFENPDNITEWYQKKIKDEGMKATSSVKTKTNGNIQNVLVGAKGNIEVRVTIRKTSNENTTDIEVTTKNY